MKTAGGKGPNRQIADRSYFIGLLRIKQSELNNEIGSLHTKLEQLQSDNSAFLQLQRREDSLQAEVSQLRGHLADYNLMVDKVRSSRDERDIGQDHEHFRAQNEGEQQRVDAIVSDRTALEQMISEAQTQVDAYHAAVQAKLEQLDPAARQRCSDMQDERSRLDSEMQQQHEELENMSRVLAREMDGLHRDPLRLRAARLHEEVTGLERQKEETENDAKGGGKPAVLDAKQQLLAQVREDNAEIARLEEECGSLKQTVKDYRRRLDANEEPAKDEDSAQVAKFEKLLQKDKEMTEFIEGFESTKRENEAAVALAQQIIVDLLEHMSQGLGQSAAMPSVEQHKQISDEADYKQKQLEHSEGTADVLQSELTKRQSEISKMADIEKKIESEVTTLREQIEQMSTDSSKHLNLAKLEDDCERQTEELAEHRRRLMRSRKTFNELLRSQKDGHDEQRTKLDANETYRSLKDAEKNLAYHETNIFVLSEFVQTRSNESNYELVKEHAADILLQLHSLIANRS